jgi:hypothetical protein
MTWARGSAYQPSSLASRCVFRSGSCTPTTSAPLAAMIFASRWSACGQAFAFGHQSLVARSKSSPP